MSEHPFDLSRFPVKLEPVPGDALRYRITIEMTADELAELIEPVLGLVKGRQSKSISRKRTNKKAQEETKARRDASLERGRLISEAVDQAKSSGLSNHEALKATAQDLNLSTELARGFMKLYRDQCRADRDDKIRKLFAAQYSVTAIAERLGVSRQAIYRVVPEAKKRPEKALTPLSILGAGHGAGRGSRFSSGDRERSERREGLDALEAPQPIAQGPGQEIRSEATTSSPGTLPTGEVRGCGGKAPALEVEPGGSS
jgi:hypothetical protein